MISYRFPDRETFRALAAAEGLTIAHEDGTEQLVTASHAHAIDEIGVITRGGEWDPETGRQLAPPETVEGWHVNYVGDPPAEWGRYVVVPRTPSRAFF